MSIATAGNGALTAGATWVGGVVPESTDDVVIDHACTLNAEVTYNSMSGIGTLTLSAGAIVNLSKSGNNLTGSIVISGPGTIHANLYSENAAGMIDIGDEALVFVGNVSAANGGIGIKLSGDSGSYDITGNISAASGAVAVYHPSAATGCTITGNMAVTGAGSKGVLIEGGGSVTTVGDITATLGGEGIYVPDSSVYHTGAVTADGAGSRGIYGNDNYECSVTGVVTGTNGGIGVYSINHGNFTITGTVIGPVASVQTGPHLPACPLILNGTLKDATVMLHDGTGGPGLSNGLVEFNCAFLGDLVLETSVPAVGEASDVGLKAVSGTLTQLRREDRLILRQYDETGMNLRIDQAYGSGVTGAQMIGVI